MANDLYKDYVNIASTGLKRNMFSGNQVGTQSIYDRNRAQDAKADMPVNNRPFKGLLGKIFGRDKKDSDYMPGTSVDEFEQQFTSGEGESVASEEDLAYTPSGNFTDDYLDTEQTDDSEDYGQSEEETEENIVSELSNVYNKARGFFPTLDLQWGKKGWIPDWLEGKQGWIPDYFQGKQGAWGDYWPSIDWVAPPEKSAEISKGLYDTNYKAGDWLYNQFSPGDSKSAGDIERMQYPEEIPIEDYMLDYRKKHSQTFMDNISDNLYSGQQGPGVGINPEGYDLLGIGEDNIENQNNNLLASLKLRNM